MGQTNASGTRNTAGVSATLTDAAANPSVTGTATYGMVWNGTTWDRAREASTASTSAATGIQAVNVVGYDTANTTWRPVGADPLGGLLTSPQRTASTTWSSASGSESTAIDCGFHQTICVQVQSLNGSWVDFQGSVNGSVYYPVSLYLAGVNANTQTAFVPQGTSYGSRASRPGLYYGPTPFRWFKLSTASATVAGSASGTYILSAAPTPPSVSGGSERGGYGRVAMTTSAQLLPANLARSVTLKASRTNTGVAYVGVTSPDTSVGVAPTASTGFDLYAGETLSLDIGNTNQIRILGTNTADSVAYVWIG